MKRFLSSLLVKLARAPAASANTSDLITTICDMGTCQNAIAIIDVDHTDDLSQLKFWTSCSDSCIASGTAQSATTNTVAVEIASDDDGLTAWNGDTAITGLTVSSNAIELLDSDGTFAVALPDIRRYLVMQYNGHGTGTHFGVTFVGRDMQESGWTGARSAY